MRTTLLTTLFLVAFSLGFSQSTAIPDANFENYLETHTASGVAVSIGHTSSMGNGIANDGFVFTSRINTVTFLDVNSLNISDLTGIENFSALTTLSCFTNNLDEIDLSSNAALVSLSIGGNNLSTINVSSNTNLEILSIVNNNISAIDLSANINLTGLGITDNNFTNINLTSNTNLEILLANNNQLTSIDLTNNPWLNLIEIGGNNLRHLNVSQNPFLESLVADNMASLTSINIQNGTNTTIGALNFIGNPNLSCILVDNVAFSANLWSPALVDGDTSVLVEDKSACTDAYVYVPDTNFEIALINLGYDDVLDDYVTIANIDTVTFLNVPDNEISDLTGIEAFTALGFLGANNNNLTTVDLSSNTNLNNLSIFNNELEALDLSDNILLFRVNCDENNIATLDLSLNTSLTDISCSANPLTALNIQNGNNSNVTFFRSQGTPDLTCIQVDEVNVFDNTNAVTGSFSSYSVDCSASLSTNDLDVIAFSMYPNPSEGNVTIDVLEEASLEIYSLLGGQVLKRDLTVGKNQLNNLNLTSGMYMFKVTTDTKSSTKKLIVH